MWLFYKKSFLTTPNVENKFCSSYEILESTGEMKLMIKLYPCSHNFSEVWNLFSRVPMGKCLYLLLTEFEDYGPRYIAQALSARAINGEKSGSITHSKMFNIICLLCVYRVRNREHQVANYFRQLFTSLAFRKKQRDWQKKNRNSSISHQISTAGKLMVSAINWARVRVTIYLRFSQRLWKYLTETVLQTGR